MDAQLLPQDVEAERTILGTILIHPPALFEAGSALKSADFYLESHRAIYEALQTLQNDQVAIDALTLKTELQKRNKLDLAGGPAYLIGLTDGISRVANVRHYAEHVKEASTLRKVIEISNISMQRAYTSEEPAKGIVEDLQLELLKLSQVTTGNGFRPAGEFATEAYKKIEEVNTKRQQLRGLDTGFRDLNRLTGGFKPGELIIIAGRPGHGKSAISSNIADNLVLRRDKTVGIFSLEMSGQELAQRSICSETPIDSYDIPNVKLDWGRIADVCEHIARSRMFIDESAGLTIMELRSRAQRLAIESKVDLIIVDYLQLMSGMGKKSDNREREISEISRGLKVLAKDLKVPVIALSQLNRDLEKSSRRPVLSDLRESGAIEQDADLVMFIWRDEMRMKTAENEGRAELIIAKQRNGKSGQTIDLEFDKRYTRFRDR